MPAALRISFALILFFISAGALLAQPPGNEPPNVPRLPPTIVEAAPVEPAAEAAVLSNGPINRGDSEIGLTPSASQGEFGSQDLFLTPLLDAHSILNSIPGVAATQEAGGGDAMVLYVRGVSVEHGSDFGVFVDGVPLNEPTHAHAQGFLNTNFLIPELVETVEYRKGSYYADLGDFCTLGAANIRTFRSLPEGLDSLSVGQYGYLRGLVANSGAAWNGDLLYAADVSYFDNGFETPEKNKRFKGLLKYTSGTDLEGTSTSLMAFHGDWFTTDSQRFTDLVTNGLYFNFDPTTGGRESRFSWNTEYWRDTGCGEWRANIYAVYDRFDLYINPEQVLDEQIHQPDGRLTTGLNVARTFETNLGPYYSPWTFGLQIRDDYINRLRRENTEGRVLIDMEQNYRANILNVSPYVQNETHWTDWARTVVGVRGDMYQYHVDDLLDPAQTLEQNTGLASPKFSLVLGPWDKTEYYFNMGTGFHSNDARGPLDPVNPSDVLLARTKSAEVGLRSETFANWKTTTAVWYSEFESEQLFNAEEGETENLGPSRRYGVDWTNTFTLTDWLTWDLDYAWAHVRFTNGDRIPRSLSGVLSTGPVAHMDNGMYGSLKFLALSPRPLTEDGSAFSNSMEVANLLVGWRRGQWDARAEVFNVFGSTDFQETVLESDLFVRPLDPSQARFTVTRYY